MEIKFNNEIQKHIADLMWNAPNQGRVNDIIKVYGTDAEIVMHMLLASYLDEDMSTDEAEVVLEKIRRKQ